MVDSAVAARLVSCYSGCDILCVCVMAPLTEGRFDRDIKHGLYYTTTQDSTCNVHPLRYMYPWVTQCGCLTIARIEYVFSA